MGLLISLKPTVYSQVTMERLLKVWCCSAHFAHFETFVIFVFSVTWVHFSPMLLEAS